MLIFLVVAATVSMTFSVTNAATNCSVCELEGPYIDTNGYSCFHVNDGNVACTCPDQRYIFNKRCRICERPNICGDNLSNTCSEISPTSLGQGSNGPYFACFCADSNYYVGKPCPPTATTIAPPAI